MPLQITTRTPEVSDFKFELLPLHSPLLRQSLLVSFPPLIDMLKFSGYPYLIRGQHYCFTQNGGPTAWILTSLQTNLASGDTLKVCYHGLHFRPIHSSRVGPALPALPTSANTTHVVMGLLVTLEQACPMECQRAQCAFKDSMIH